MPSREEYDVANEIFDSIVSHIEDREMNAHYSVDERETLVDKLAEQREYITDWGNMAEGEAQRLVIDIITVFPLIEHGDIEEVFESLYE